MIYNTKKEALVRREKFMEVENSPEFVAHCKRYYFYTASDKYNHRKFGKFFLYERETNGTKNKLHYPQLAIYLNELPCDQTTEVEFLNYRKSWEWRTEYKTTYTDKDGLSKDYEMYVAEEPSEIERVILWSDSMYVYGSWDKMPSWKELRQAYGRTWWYHRTTDKIRDLQLDRILG